MREIKDLIKAQQNLLKAQEGIPKNIREAAEKLSEKTGMDYYGALEILDMVAPTGRVQTAHKKGKRNVDALIERNKRVKGFGGRINPENLGDIKKRITKSEGDKRDLYQIAYVLFKNKNKWVSKKELTAADINTRLLRNKRRVTACLPAGYVMQSSAHGYRAFSIKEALA